MPTELITVTVSGPNSKTQQVPVVVNPSTGTGSAVFTWTGANFGLDSISAAGTVAGQNLSSNVAQARWGYNDITAWFDNVQFTGGSSYSFVVIGVFPDGTYTGPSNVITCTGTHFGVNWTNIPGVSYYNVYCTAAYWSSTPTVTVGKIHGVSSPSANGGNNSYYEAGGGPNYPQGTTRLWRDNGSWFPFAGDGTVAPATNTTIAPPSGGTATGKLQLTPTGQGHVVGTTGSLTVTLTGIVYTSIPYIPLYESVSGSLPLYNSGNLNQFTYPQYNSQNVDNASAATYAWVVGPTDPNNNNHYNGRVGVTYNGTNFNFNYNGASPDSGADLTNIMITADDVAWYNAAQADKSKAYDVFAASGGVSTTLLLEWLVKAQVASVSPTTVTGDGTTKAFTVNLAKPISPRQHSGQYGTGNSLSATFSASGGTVTNPSGTAIYDGNGWLTGWTVNITVPNTTSNTTITLNANIGGTITYLNGSSFTTGPVTYQNGAIATINVTGAAFTVPQAYQFTVAPAGPSYSGVTTLSFTGIVFQQQNNPITMQFIGVDSTSAAQFTVGTGVQTSRTTGSYNGQTGWLTTFTFGPWASSNLSGFASATLGFVATDSTSGLSVTYLTSTQYSYLVLGGGGGGSTGCPALEMWLSEGLQVVNAGTGTYVSTLIDNFDYYLEPTDALKRELPISQMDVIEQPCFYQKTGNGAELVVSLSTPMPYLETTKAVYAGETTPENMVDDEFPVYVRDAKVGLHVMTDVGDGLEWSPLVEVTYVGIRKVARMSVSQHNFAAGVVPGKYIYSHNNLAMIVK